MYTLRLPKVLIFISRIYRAMWSVGFSDNVVAHERATVLQDVESSCAIRPFPLASSAASVERGAAPKHLALNLVCLIPGEQSDNFRLLDQAGTSAGTSTGTARWSTRSTPTASYYRRRPFDGHRRVQPRIIIRGRRLWSASCPKNQC